MVSLLPPFPHARGTAIVTGLSLLLGGAVYRVDTWQSWFNATAFLLVPALLFFAIRSSTLRSLWQPVWLPLTLFAGFLTFALLGIFWQGAIGEGLSHWLWLAALGTLPLIGAAIGKSSLVRQWWQYGVIAIALGLVAEIILTNAGGVILRFTSLLGNSNALGAFLTVPLCSSLAFSAQARGWRRVVWFAVVALLCIGFIGSISLTSWFSLALATLGVAVCVRQARGALTRAILPLVIAGALAVTLLLGFRAFLAPAGTAGVVYSFDPAVSARTSLTQRWNFLRATWEITRDAPLTGVGLGEFQRTYARYAPNPIEQPTSAHNDVAQRFAETGVAGGALFAASLVAFLVLGARRLRTQPTPERTLLFVAALALVIHSLVEFSWLFPAVAILGWVLLGVIAADDHERDFATPALFGVRIVLIALVCLFVAHGAALALSAQAQDAANIAEQRGDQVDAARSWRLVRLFDPRPTTYRYELFYRIRTATDEVDWRAAEGLAQQALVLGRHEYATWNTLGRIRLGLGDLPGAEAALREALVLDPIFHLDIQNNLAIVLRDEGRTEEAKALLRQVLDAYDPYDYLANPTLPELRARLATFLGRLEAEDGDAAAARASYERALRYLPTYQPALQALAQ